MKFLYYSCVTFGSSLVYKKAVLSQGEPRDAAVNFDGYRILQRHFAVSLPQHSTAFLYRPTSATVQMLKLHKVGLR